MALQVALSDVAGELPLFDYGEGTINHGTSSLRRDHNGDSRTAIPVQVLALDAIVQQEKLTRLDFIKIDTEGNEWKVLQGAQQTLQRFLPTILFEYEKPYWQNNGCSPDEARSFLKALHYRIYEVHGDHLTETAGSWPASANLLAVPKFRSF